MTTMTGEDYRQTYWPLLRGAIDRLLLGPPSPNQAGPVIEFEPMYSAAYKCVCQQHSETLYADLLFHLHTHYVAQATDLQRVEDGQLIDACYHLIHCGMYSLDGIIPIFTYLNKVYVWPKLSSNLRTELQNLFCTTVIDPVIERLMGIIQSTERRPFTAPPHVLASLIKNFHKLNANYAQRFPQVFSRYIPGVLPAMREQELSSYITATQHLQASLRRSWTTEPSTTRGTKRCLDEELHT